MVGLQEVRGVGVSHFLLQDRQTEYVQAAGAHISPATCHKIQHDLLLWCTRVCLFRGFLWGGFLTQVCQCEELQKEFKLLFHSHGLYVKGLEAFAGVMTRLPTSEANSGVAASPMCTVNIYRSRAILWRSGNRVLHWSNWKHLMCRDKDSSKFVGRWSGYMVACHTSVCFYEGLVCFFVLKHPPSSFIPSLWIPEVQGPISKQCNSILECWVKSMLKFDHDGLVIIVLRKVYELLELVNVVINWVLGLVPAGAFQLGEGHELFILRTELIKEGLFKCFPISEVVSFALAFRLEYFVHKVGCSVWLEEGEYPVDLRLVIWKEVNDDCEVDATCIEECTSFLLVAIKVCWHCWLDLCQCTGISFICLSPTISETIFRFWFSEIQLALHYIHFSWEKYLTCQG